MRNGEKFRTGDEASSPSSVRNHEEQQQQLFERPSKAAAAVLTPVLTSVLAGASYQSREENEEIHNGCSDEQRSDTEAIHRCYHPPQPSLFEKRERILGEREGTVLTNNNNNNYNNNELLDRFNDECDSDETTTTTTTTTLIECSHLWLLHVDEEEERMLQQEWEEQEHTLWIEEERAISVLDEMLQIHHEEYPDAPPYNSSNSSNNEQEHGSDEEGDAAHRDRRQARLVVANIIDEEDDCDFDFDFDRGFLPGGTPLSNDSEIEELVALCDRRDREGGGIFNNNNNACNVAQSSNPNHSAQQTPYRLPAVVAVATCVVCLDAPRTHAYVPCGHLCVCFSCAKEQLKRRVSPSAASACPVCQQPSTRIMRIFVP